MYIVYSENAEEEQIMFGIANENQTFACFTDKKEEAEALASELNLLGVEEIHVLDIIEDRFYSGCTL